MMCLAETGVIELSCLFPRPFSFFIAMTGSFLKPLSIDEDGAAFIFGVDTVVMKLNVMN